MQIQSNPFSRIVLEKAGSRTEPRFMTADVPVEKVLESLKAGKPVDQVLGDYPGLEKEDIYQALGLATFNHLA